MQIQTIQSNQYQYKKTSFGHLSRAVLDGKAFGEKISYRNDTFFFRNVDFWQVLVSFFEDKFKNIPKINTYCYGCSDGSEPFTFIMSLFSNLKEEFANKFLPIKAKDIDKKIIENAQKNEYYFIKRSEKENINTFTYGQYHKYFTEIEPVKEAGFVFAKDILSKNVDFSIADISKDYKKIKPDNSIIFARNFWPYIKNSSLRENFFMNLYDHLGKNSYLVIGEFDVNGTSYNILNEITNAGFVETDIINVYTKK